ncbi:hypothetical protein LPB140_01590 [Sphingorhabdus lutea]|uniref:Ubiquinol-cytochrome c chaperone domain-containing protein n=1 Tax=Sphingorhabdus lutea TaxID=1913578 RepID=A0A1L3J9D5_9SPHN|nr:ubiquinol-cytochrome C chaperone family protein [Sphingorhabdus lutea]APG61737.1 hypothetical protein LPB140_01590 [Sphingorhabdus lutea]
MNLFKKLFSPRVNENQMMIPYYRNIINAARNADFYSIGEIPDELDHRFDIITIIMALATLRLEEDGDKDQEMVYLTEIFIEDMDGQLRELGIGDMVVGKHIGRMMSALGGRLTIFRAALNENPPEPMLSEALKRNLYEGIEPSDQAIKWMVHQIIAMSARLKQINSADLIAGDDSWIKAA